MKNESLIHVKFDYDEALQSKRDLLDTERFLMISTTKAKKYHSLKDEELKIKINLQKKVKELVTDIKKIQKNLPKIESEEEVRAKKTTETKKVEHGDDIGSQLKEIQGKLNALAK
jgi:hypothetical protein|tara:strand:- start:5529 stop:5873 length:345 start_codon:yes stop_codon:yes gene_type:complete